MTITLPYPTPAGDAFADNDGGNALNSPPVGAPEGNATETVNDIQRRDKTAIKQNVENIDAINAALGDMAEQDASAVAITGGTIGAGVSVALAVNSTQLGGVTLQALFDLIYPVNDAVVLRHDESPPPAWPTISATWSLIAESFYLKAITSGQTVGETFGASTTDPATGNTGDTVLTEAQMPAHLHNIFAAQTATSKNVPNDLQSSSVAGAFGDNDDYEVSLGPNSTLEPSRGISSSVGGDAAHSHDLNSHAHDFDPPTYRIAVYRRTA